MERRYCPTCKKYIFEKSEIWTDRGKRQWHICTPSKRTMTVPCWSEERRLRFRAEEENKRLKEQIDFAQTCIETGQEHACPLCKDYLKEAEQVLNRQKDGLGVK